MTRCGYSKARKASRIPVFANIDKPCTAEHIRFSYCTQLRSSKHGRVYTSTMLCQRATVSLIPYYVKYRLHIILTPRAKTTLYGYVSIIYFGKRCFDEEGIKNNTYRKIEIPSNGEHCVTGLEK